MPLPRATGQQRRQRKARGLKERKASSGGAWTQTTFIIGALSVGVLFAVITLTVVVVRESSASAPVLTNTPAAASVEEARSRSTSWNSLRQSRAYEPLEPKRTSRSSIPDDDDAIQKKAKRAKRTKDLPPGWSSTRGHSVIPLGVPGASPQFGGRSRSRRHFDKEAILMQNSLYRAEKWKKEEESMKAKRRDSPTEEDYNGEGDRADHPLREDEEIDEQEETTATAETSRTGQEEDDKENGVTANVRKEEKEEALPQPQAVRQPQPGDPFKILMDDETFCITPSYRNIKVRPTMTTASPPKYGPTFSRLKKKDQIEIKCGVDPSFWLYDEDERRSWKGKIEWKNEREQAYVVKIPSSASEAWVGCGDNWNIYTFVRRKEGIVRRALGSGAQTSTGNKRNVLLITLDSMSNMDFQRSMLKTNDVLESLSKRATVPSSAYSDTVVREVSPLQANFFAFSPEVSYNFNISKPREAFRVVSLRQHHAERDYTDPNHITLATGLHMTELEKTAGGVHLIQVEKQCWDNGICSDFKVYKGYPYDIDDPTREQECNTCLFTIAKNHGYVTSFGRYSAMEPYSRRIDNLFGFRESSPQPTDHQQLRPYRDPRYVRKANVNKPKSRLQFDHVMQFFSVYHDVPKFAMFDLKDGHDKDVSTMDQVLSDFLKEFLREHGDNTVIAIVGDHGPHYANRYPIREVSEIHAAFEVVNPVAAFILPKTMTQEKPEAEKHLKNNAGRLTSHADVYCTLKYLLLEGTTPMRDTPPDPLDCYNLLEEDIPADRTCADARLDYCLCNCAAREQQKRPCGPPQLSRKTGEALKKMKNRSP